MRATAGDTPPFPRFCVRFGRSGSRRRTAPRAKESGLNLSRLMTQIQNRKFYLDPEVLYQQLDYASLGFDGGRAVEEGVAESMAAL